MQMRVRWGRRAVLRAIGAAILVAACGGGGGDKKGTDTGAAAGGQASAGGAGDQIKIAVIGKSSTNPVFLAARTGAEQAAKDLSAKHNIKVEVMWLTPPQEDGQVQAQRIQQAVNDGANAVLISCSDASKLTGAIDDAVNRGVVVMTFDSDAPQSKRFAFYGVDDMQTGQATMAELAKAMGGKGKVAILAGNQNAPNLQKRVQGVKAEAAKYPGISVAGTFNHIETPQDAAGEVVRVNNAYPDIAGWAMIGGWPLFTQTLLTDINPARMKIVAVDALPAELAYVEKGIAPVLLAQPVYKWGYVGVETIVDKVHFKKDPPQPVIPMELVRVTKDNLGAWARQLKEWGFTDVPQKYLDLKT
ncbi:MAG TPA: substrate-binding domain-containing protein [Gemmatimonadaceae bacterium]|nr:substrate-binding domain-containing protein [Gemmatimonadaceae bacterium]